jgi:hypothetical protein
LINPKRIWWNCVAGSLRVVFTKKFEDFFAGQAKLLPFTVVPVVTTSLTNVALHTLSNLLFINLLCLDATSDAAVFVVDSTVDAFPFVEHLPAGSTLS